MSPALLLVIIIVGVVILAVILAHFTTRKPDNNGLRFEHEIRSLPRIR